MGCSNSKANTAVDSIAGYQPQLDTENQEQQEAAAMNESRIRAIEIGSNVEV